MNPDNVLIGPDDVRRSDSTYARRGSLFVPARLAPAPTRVTPTRQQSRRMQQLAKKAFLKQMKSNAIKERKLLNSQQAVNELIYKPSSIFTKV